MLSKLFLFVFLIGTCTLVECRVLEKFRQSFEETLKSGTEKQFRTRRDTENDPKDPYEVINELLEDYETNKAKIIAEIVNSLSSFDTNVTVMGWQLVKDDHGKVLEEVLVEFVVPPMPRSNTEDKDVNRLALDDDQDDDDDTFIPYKELNELRGYLEGMQPKNIPMHVTYEEFDSSGKHEMILFVGVNELYVNIDGFSIYNQTLTLTPEELEKKLESVQPMSSIVKFDENGKFIEEGSKITPLLLGCVEDSEDIPDDIFLTAPAVIAEISQKYPKAEISKHLTEEFNKEYTNYTWKTLVDPEDYYVHKDVSITLCYDNLDLDPDSGVSYYVYGVEKK